MSNYLLIKYLRTFTQVLSNRLCRIGIVVCISQNTDLSCSNKENKKTK